MRYWKDLCEYVLISDKLQISTILIVSYGGINLEISDRPVYVVC